MTQTYKVIWEMDIEADCPKEAAEKARHYQTVPETTATVFHVSSETGELTTVDLLDGEDQE